MTKQELRHYWLQHRLNLSESEKNNLSIQIRDLLFDEIPVQRASNISIFLPVSEKCEVRTWGIINHLQAHYPHIQLSAPRIKNFISKEMESVGIESHTSFAKNKWGIEEPETGPVINPSEIDIIFIPLIAFDLSGHRLGYGGGFYDRYLEKCTKAVKIGLSYFGPIEKIPETSMYDIPMDQCLTPEKLYKFPSKHS